MLTTNSSVFATRADVIARPAEVADKTDKQWLMLAVLLLGQFMGLLDVFVVNVALPTIGADLDASGASLQLVVGGYTVAYAMLLITGARLGDLHGRRRMYLLGVIVFTAASLGCGLASSSLALIVFRLIQGAGAAVMVPQIMSVIQTQFNGTARATAPLRLRGGVGERGGRRPHPRWGPCGCEPSGRGLATSLSRQRSLWNPCRAANC